MKNMAATADKIAERLYGSPEADADWMRDEIDLFTGGGLDTTEMDLMEDMVHDRLRKRYRAAGYH